MRPLNGGWRNGLPLALLEDPDLYLPPGAQRLDWLSEWHSEQEWFRAIHKTRYSNGVIGITEELSPVGENVPGRPGMDRSCFATSGGAESWCRPIFICSRPTIGTSM